MIWKQDIWIAPGRQDYYDMSSLLYDCNYWATNFITGLLFELRGLKGSMFLCCLDESQTFNEEM